MKINVFLFERGGSEIAFSVPRNLEFQNKIFREEYGGKRIQMTVGVENVEAEYKRIRSLDVSIDVELRAEECN